MINNTIKLVADCIRRYHNGNELRFTRMVQEIDGKLIAFQRIESLTDNKSLNEPSGWHPVYCSQDVNVEKIMLTQSGFKCGRVL